MTISFSSFVFGKIVKVRKNVMDFISKVDFSFQIPQQNKNLEYFIQLSQFESSLSKKMS